MRSFTNCATRGRQLRGKGGQSGVVGVFQKDSDPQTKYELEANAKDRICCEAAETRCRAILSKLKQRWQTAGRKRDQMVTDNHLWLSKPFDPVCSSPHGQSSAQPSQETPADVPPCHSNVCVSGAGTVPSSLYCASPQSN